MADTITIRGMEKRSERFLAAQNLEDISRLLGKTSVNLLALAKFPSYEEFQIPKKNGGMRHIENPIPSLKKVQRKLNDYLQAVYYFIRSDAAYGFLTNPVDDPIPRHILSNAQIHIGCQWLLNVDAKDFFHLIKEDSVIGIFRNEPFRFSKGLATLLAGLCTYKGRLPMGAPTSPILSNFASRRLDDNLLDFAKAKEWKYTRYADDMSFSAKTEITTHDVEKIRAIVEQHGFLLNPDKKKLFGPSHTQKEVTGLIVQHNRIDLPDDYLYMLEQAIDHLDKVVDAQFATPSGRGQQTKWVEELKVQIQGKLEYARQILGEEDLQYMDLMVQFDEASTPPEYFGPVNWLDFGYTAL